MKLQGEIIELAGAASADPVGARKRSTFCSAWSDRCPSILISSKALLVLKSEAARMQAVISYFEAILPNLRRSVRVRQKAGGNGHVH